MTCVLVKYRVPEEGHYPENVEDLEDAQQAMRLTRSHASEWHLDPNRIGVIGFSAGAHLAVVLSTHPDFQGKNVPSSTIDARPNFQMVIYPGWLSGPGREGEPVTPAHGADSADVSAPGRERLHGARREFACILSGPQRREGSGRTSRVHSRGPRFRSAAYGTAHLALACAGRDVAAYGSYSWAAGACGSAPIRALRVLVGAVVPDLEQSGGDGEEDRAEDDAEGAEEGDASEDGEQMVAVWARRWEPTRIG